jgi:hypothetical protein
MKAASEVLKKAGATNQQPRLDALKTFDQGLGPLLDKVEAAYKAGKDGDVKKHAQAAVAIANKYVATLADLPDGLGTGSANTLRNIREKLGELWQKGISAPNYFP